MGIKRPPRLEGFDYAGIHGYSLTICTFDRRIVFASKQIVDPMKAEFLRTAKDYRFEINAYCFMPDHLHGLVEGLTDDSDFRRFVAMFKQRSAFHYRKVAGATLWQEGFYDYVIRSHESYPGVAAYILNNPIRAGLCRTIDEYPFMGSSRYSLDELRDVVQIRSRPFQGARQSRF